MKKEAEKGEVTLSKSGEQLLRITLFKIMLKDYAISILTGDKEACDMYYNNIIQELYLILEENE